jgi:hypothetical protein
LYKLSGISDLRVAETARLARSSARHDARAGRLNAVSVADVGAPALRVDGSGSRRLLYSLRNRSAQPREREVRRARVAAGRARGMNAALGGAGDEGARKTPFPSTLES